MTLDATLLDLSICKSVSRFQQVVLPRAKALRRPDSCTPAMEMIQDQLVPCSPKSLETRGGLMPRSSEIPSHRDLFSSARCHRHRLDKRFEQKQHCSRKFWTAARLAANGVGLQNLQVNEFQNRHMGRFQDYRCCVSGLVGFFPAKTANTPPVARL